MTRLFCLLFSLMLVLTTPVTSCPLEDETGENPVTSSFQEKGKEREEDGAAFSCPLTGSLQDIEDYPTGGCQNCPQPCRQFSEKNTHQTLDEFLERFKPVVHRDLWSFFETTFTILFTAHDNPETTTAQRRLSPEEENLHTDNLFLRLQGLRGHPEKQAFYITKVLLTSPTHKEALVQSGLCSQQTLDDWEKPVKVIEWCNHVRSTHLRNQIVEKPLPSEGELRKSKESPYLSLDDSDDMVKGVAAFIVSFVFVPLWCTIVSLF